MLERDKLLRDLRSILISLYFTYGEGGDMETKKKLVDHVLDILDGEIVQSFEYEEPRYELTQYLIDEVGKRFGKEK